MVVRPSKSHPPRVVELENCLKEKEVQLSNAIQSAASQRTSLTESYTKTIDHTNESHKEAIQVNHREAFSLTPISKGVHMSHT